MIPDCNRRGAIIGDECECSSNRLRHLRPGMAPLAVCSVCPYANKPDRVIQPRETFDCVHRGQVLRNEKCGMCGSRDVMVDVLACAIHGECTVHAHGLTAGRAGPKLAVCVGCPQRSAEAK